MIPLFIIIVYAAVISYFIIGFDRLKMTSEILKTEKPALPFTQFSIVIPFRNEAKNLNGLLQSLAKINYPKDCFEILLIDDESTDGSIDIIEQFKAKNPSITLNIYDNVRHTAAPKKDAITTAIKKSNYEWIITTDADCILPVFWLQSYHNYIANHPVSFVAGPVIYKTTNSFIDQYQLLDLLSLQGITIGSFGQGKGLFCNGANLAYTKTLFNALQGFSNNSTIASGDDVFMLENAQAQFPEKIGYLKSRLAIVETFPENSWKKIITQRTRWAKKTGKQKNIITKLIGVIVFLTNLYVLLSPLIILVYPKFIWVGIFALVSKVLIDFMLLQKTARFFGRHISAVRVITHFYVYAMVSTWVVLRNPFISYGWKGRKHRQ